MSASRDPVTTRLFCRPNTAVSTASSCSRSVAMNRQKPRESARNIRTRLPKPEMHGGRWPLSGDRRDARAGADLLGPQDTPRKDGGTEATGPGRPAMHGAAGVPASATVTDCISACQAQIGVSRRPDGELSVSTKARRREGRRRKEERGKEHMGRRKEGRRGKGSAPSHEGWDTGGWRGPGTWDTGHTWHRAPRAV